MISASRQLITLLGIIAVVVLYILLGRYPNSFTAYISSALLICGLILLFIVNAYVGKKRENISAAEQQDREPGAGDNEL
jgi:multisubunit Na+/H+ antiporter MnhB subunit